MAQALGDPWAYSARLRQGPATRSSPVVKGAPRHENSLTQQLAVAR
jgi:hypothetical protein